MTKREADELALIEDNIEVDEVTTKMAATERGPCKNILSPVEAAALEAAHEKANDAKAAEKAAENEVAMKKAIKKDALYDQMIADWKKAAAAKAVAEESTGKAMKNGQLAAYNDDKKESEGKLSTQSPVDTDPDNKDQKTLPEDAAAASEANKKKGYSDDGVGGGTKQDAA